MGRLTRLIFPGLLLVAGYYALFGGEHSVFELRSARSADERARVELEALRAENAALAARVDSLEGDAALLERLAREQFGMIRDGEVLYRFVDDTIAPDTIPATGGRER